MSGKRKDKKGRVLRAGESQRKDLTFQYRYQDVIGKRCTVYAPTPEELLAKEDKHALIHREMPSSQENAKAEIS